MLKFVTDLFKPSAPKPVAPMTSDTSMTFTVTEVSPFLTQLDNNPRFIFPTGFAHKIVSGIKTLTTDDRRRWTLTCDLDRQPIVLEIDTLMEDAETVELTFFSTQAAVAEIDKDLAAFDAAK